MIIHEKLEQRSEEWYKLRELRMTASNAISISNYINSTTKREKTALETYCKKLVMEKFLLQKTEIYQNEDLKRGIEKEPFARLHYEIKNNSEVKEIGFVEYDEFVGCSPDGFVGENGLLEIKCPNNYNYFSYLLSKKIQDEHYWQMQMQMLICKKDWCDYVVYNDNFDKFIIIQRVEKDIKAFETLQLGFEAGKRFIKHYLEEFNNLS